MNIAELRIQNVKRIEAFAIAPENGEPVLLTGDNAQGKSSVLDAIFLALANKGLEDPVRHGTSKATVKLKLGGGEVEYNIERVITKKTNSVRVTTKDGEVKSPQAFLNSLVGNLAFDPLDFMRQKPREQAQTIRDLVGLDTSKLDNERSAIFAQRTEVNRALDTEKKQLDGMARVEVPAETQETEVSASTLIQQRDAINAILAAARVAGEASKKATADAHETNKHIANLRDQLAAAEKRAVSITTLANQYAAKADAEAAKAAETGDAAAIDRQIADLDNINRGIRERREARERALKAAEARAAKEQAVETVMRRSESLTEQLATIDEQKNRLTRAAKMPVDGMTFDEEGVFVGNIRLDQMSTAEQVRISTAVAMRGNPQLRLILIREGALLNKATIAAILNEAKDKQYQVFIEKFQEEPGTEGLHIVDGRVSHIDGEPVKKAETAEPQPPSDSLL